jgi:hypothetical protein
VVDRSTLDGFLGRPLTRAHVRAFADDITVICYGEKMLLKVWKIIKRWSNINRVPINIDKSSVMLIKKDQRTPNPMAWNFEVPLVKEMKYLGVMIRDDLSLKTTLKQKKEEEKKQKKVDWILRDQKLSGHTRYHIFTSLFKSKTSYASNLIAIMDNKAVLWQRDSLYRSCKSLLGIKQMVKKETILELCLGKNWEDFLLAERQNTVASLLNAARAKEDKAREEEITRLLEGTNTELPEENREGFERVWQPLPIKEILEANLGPRIKWRL